MMRVFLDTNILLDIIEERQKFLVASANVFDLGVRKQILLFASPLTIANCVYSARKNVGYPKALKGMKLLKQYIEIAAMDDKQVSCALEDEVPDFEDRLQFESAIAAKCTAIVTRDKKRHFPQDKIPILSPEQFLDHFNFNSYAS